MLIPITIGSPEPIFHNGKSCISVPIPAMIIAFCISIADCSVDRPLAPATIMIGAMLATNIARICCNPKGTAFKTGTFPSIW